MFIEAQTAVNINKSNDKMTPVEHLLIELDKHIVRMAELGNTALGIGIVIEDKYAQSAFDAIREAGYQLVAKKNTLAPVWTTLIWWDDKGKEQE